MVVWVEEGRERVRIDCVCVVVMIDLFLYCWSTLFFLFFYGRRDCSDVSSLVMIRWLVLPIEFRLGLFFYSLKRGCFCLLPLWGSSFEGLVIVVIVIFIIVSVVLSSYLLSIPILLLAFYPLNFISLLQLRLFYSVSQVIISFLIIFYQPWSKVLPIYF